MNSEGLCTSSLLQNWQPNATCSNCISSLISVFSSESPVREASIEDRQQQNGSFGKPNEPLNVNQHQPSISFDDMEASQPVYSSNSNFQDSKIRELQSKLKRRYDEFSKQMNQNIDDIFREGDQLLQHSKRLEQYQSAIEQDISNFTRGINVFSEKTSGLQHWINFESNAQNNRTPEDMLRIDGKSSQYVSCLYYYYHHLFININELFRLIDCVASDAAYEDCLFVLRQELHQNKIQFDDFLKVIKTIKIQYQYNNTNLTIILISFK